MLCRPGCCLLWSSLWPWVHHTKAAAFPQSRGQVWYTAPHGTRTKRQHCRSCFTKLGLPARSLVGWAPWAARFSALSAHHCAFARCPVRRHARISAGAAHLWDCPPDRLSAVHPGRRALEPFAVGGQLGLAGQSLQCGGSGGGGRCPFDGRHDIAARRRAAWAPLGRGCSRDHLCARPCLVAAGDRRRGLCVTQSLGCSDLAAGVFP